MHVPPLLTDLVLLIACAIPALAVAQRFHVPSVVGFLLTGLVIGPHALGLVSNPAAVAQLAEIGVVLLLFAIGLELSVSRIARMGRWVVRGGALQVILTMAVTAAVAVALGRSTPRAVFLGSLVALSSTAIVLKLLSDRGELDTPSGRVVVAILIFQDLCVVPLMLLVPILGGGGGSGLATGRMLLVALSVVAALVWGGGLAVRWVLARVTALRNRELFTLCIVAIGLGAAWLTSLVGLSLALGAFLAGLVISESEYGLQALSDVLPFRDAFSGIFFISVGMLLDLGVVSAAWPAVFGLALGAMVLKTGLVAAIVRWMGRSWSVGVTSGLALAGIGEFSFILAEEGAPLGLLTPGEYQVFLGASVVTMLATPLLVHAAPQLAERLAGGHAPDASARGLAGMLTLPTRDHVIIVGYGFTGRSVAAALRSADVPYVVLEENGPVVRQARLDREPVCFGDGTRAEVLERVGVHHARAIVFAIASANEERRGVAVARRLNPAVHIVVRTRRVRWARDLQRLGANEVIPEELEASVEIFGRVLRLFEVPPERIRHLMAETRRDDYRALLGDARPVTRVDLPVTPPAAGRSPAEDGA